MKVSFENPDKINGLLTITVEDDDYKAEVEKTLKEYRKTANVPGFRPGQVPMGMIRRRFGFAGSLVQQIRNRSRSLFPFQLAVHLVAQALGEVP